jgi:hypothetical protein
MADNSLMGNVTQVENYGKKLKKGAEDMRRQFKQLQQETRNVGGVWTDAQFQNFENIFNREIVRNVDKMCTQMDIMSDYVKKMVEWHRRAQQEKIRL